MNYKYNIAYTFQVGDTTWIITERFINDEGKPAYALRPHRGKKVLKLSEVLLTQTMQEVKGKFFSEDLFTL